MGKLVRVGQKWGMSSTLPMQWALIQGMPHSQDLTLNLKGKVPPFLFPTKIYILPTQATYFTIFTSLLVLVLSFGMEGDEIRTLQTFGVYVLNLNFNKTILFNFVTSRSEKEIVFFPFCVSIQRKYSTYLSTLFDHIHSSFGIGFIILNGKGVDTRTLQTFMSFCQSLAPTIHDFTNKPISLIQKELDHVKCIEFTRLYMVQGGNKKYISLSECFLS